jgi:hypothetical protein
MNIENMKTVLVASYLASEDYISGNLFVEFIPDELIVNGIVFSKLDSEDVETYVLQNTSLSQFSIQIPFGSGPYYQDFHLKFPIKKNINGIHDFLIYTADPASSSSIKRVKISGDFYMSLTFIKYKDPK